MEKKALKEIKDVDFVIKQLHLALQKTLIPLGFLGYEIDTLGNNIKIDMDRFEITLGFGLKVWEYINVHSEFNDFSPSDIEFINDVCKRIKETLNDVYKVD